MPPLLLIALLIFSSLGSIIACRSLAPVSSAPDIVGGVLLDSTNPLARHVVALIDKKDEIFCSGVLVSDTAIITAAHCLVDRDKEDFLIAFWDPKLKKISALVKAASWKFVDPQKGNIEFPNFDLAVIHLLAKAPAFFLPVEIAADAMITPSNPLTLVGFGKTSTECKGKTPPCSGEPRVIEQKVKEKVSNSRFFHLMVVKGDLGQGSCMGDSGGPAFIRHKNHWYLAGTTTGVFHLFNKAVHENPAQICESGESIYTMTAGYHSWLAAELHGKPKPSYPVMPRPGVNAAFVEWCRYDNFGDAAWSTTQRLLEIAAQNQDEVPPRKIFEDCETANAVLMKLSEVELSIPKISTPLLDLSPLASLPIKKLSFHFNDLSRSAFPALPSVEELEISAGIFFTDAGRCDIANLQNLKRFSLSFNRGGNFDLQCLARLRNLIHLELYDARVGGWESLSQLTSLRTLNITGMLKPDNLVIPASIESVTWEAG